MYYHTENIQTQNIGMCSLLLLGAGKMLDFPLQQSVLHLGDLSAELSWEDVEW